MATTINQLSNAGKLIFNKDIGGAISNIVSGLTSLTHSATSIGKAFNSAGMGVASFIASLALSTLAASVQYVEAQRESLVKLKQEEIQ